MATWDNPEVQTVGTIALAFLATVTSQCYLRLCSILNLIPSPTPILKRVAFYNFPRLLTDFLIVVGIKSSSTKKTRKKVLLHNFSLTDNLLDFLGFTFILDNLRLIIRFSKQSFRTQSSCCQYCQIVYIALKGREALSCPYLWLTNDTF